MMLEHLGEADMAARLLATIERVRWAVDMLTTDPGGTVTTQWVTEGVCEGLITTNI